MSEPKIAQKAPFVIEVEEGSYAWCACGASHNQPYCDGSHRGSGIEPMVVKIEEKKTVAWCGCKHSSNKPYCDASHKNL
ncbi:MAG: CDGSH iron-sulfur domain-containing protein [Candidatus Omnitrophica bacterium]|nr:CDGSH iron-sulfur domain-containing protein [Candidatus Omnitrophota bacterium]